MSEYSGKEEAGGFEKDLLTFSANWTAAGPVQDLVLQETRQTHSVRYSQGDSTRSEKMAEDLQTDSEKHPRWNRWKRSEQTHL